MVKMSVAGPVSAQRRMVQAAVFVAVAWWVPRLLGVEGQLAAGLGLFLFIGLLWLTETLHVTTTALLVPVLAVFLGIFDLREALAGFAHPIIFLFFGGFALAAALQAHQLDAVIAARVVRIARGRLLPAMLLTCVVTAALSMWVSNTATTAMMLPLALGMLAGVGAERRAELSAFLLLGIAWSANIGGIGTLVGSPPNAIVAAYTGMNFADWLKIGLPTALVLLPLALGTLWLLLRPAAGGVIADTGSSVHAAPGSRLVLVIFLLTLAGWVLGEPLARWAGIEKDFDSVVALVAALALLATGRLQWNDLERHVNWGVLLLFGGGITLSAAMGATGASSFLGEQLQAVLSGAGAFTILLVVTLFVVMLTELVSNTASAALLVPLFGSMAVSMGSDPRILAIAIGISASCAFMLPVATPPNALVFGTGRVPQRVMMRCGLVMNLLATGVVAAMVYFLIGGASMHP